VIRKEGTRPDSPTVKMKTISQRQEEERERQRLERAERRARRSEDGLGLIDLVQDQNDPFDSSIASIQQSPCNGEERNTNGAIHLPKHRRGPGDEEDYETPDRPAKRSRYDEDGGMAEKKQVKWDRGLSTAIFLEEVHPRTRHRPKEDLVMKGCLAKTSKVREHIRAHWGVPVLIEVWGRHSVWTFWGTIRTQMLHWQNLFTRISSSRNSCMTTTYRLQPAW
jgi:hypothetical protein